jgi:hypothetical protein
MDELISIRTTSLEQLKQVMFILETKYDHHFKHLNKDNSIDHILYIINKHYVIPSEDNPYYLELYKDKENNYKISDRLSREHKLVEGLKFIRKYKLQNVN